MKKILFIVSFLCVSMLSMAQVADSAMTVKHGGKHHSNKDNHGQKVAQVATLQDMVVQNVLLLQKWEANAQQTKRIWYNWALTTASIV